MLNFKYFILPVLFALAGPIFAQQTAPAKTPVINEFYYWVFSYPATKQQPPKTGYAAMNSPERLPYLFPPGFETKQFCSYDVAGGNNDGNFNKAFTRYIDSKGEHVIFDEYGPGALYRQQMNIWISDKFGVLAGAGKARIKYYFDNEPTPRIDCTVDDLFGKSASPFNAFLNFADTAGLFKNKSAGRFVLSYTPVTFKKRLKITVTPPNDWSGRNTTWYQDTYLSYPPGFPVESWKAGPAKSQPVQKQWGNLGIDPKGTTGNISLNYDKSIKNGDSTIIRLNKPGSIASLKIMLSPYTKATFYNTQIKIYWDNDNRPAVDVPLSCFFGASARGFLSDSLDLSGRSLKTLFFGFNGREHTFYTYWPMPFWKNSRIVLVNHSGTDINQVLCHISLKPAAVYAYPYGQAGHFYAKRTKDQNWTTKPYAAAFHENGRGQVVGISFFSYKYNMDGDEFTFIDGSLTPQIHGDGTEDDHNQGWGGGDYQQPLWGSLLTGYEGAYRIYMNDAYIFNKSIDINYEHDPAGPGGSPATQTDVLIYYYKSPLNDTLRLTDRVDIGNTGSEKRHNYHIRGQVWQGSVESSYDGYNRNREYHKVTDSGRAFTGSSSFEVAINPLNNGIRLRRRLDRKDNGQQLAWVYIDGKKISKPWYAVTYSACPDNQRWYDSDFEIPSAYTKGKRKIAVRIVAGEMR